VAVETSQAPKTANWKVNPMSIPIPAETPDPNIDKPALPDPAPESPPDTMPPVIPKGDPPAEERPAVLDEAFPE